MFRICLLVLGLALPLLAQPLDRRRVDELALANQPRLQAARLEVEAYLSLIDQADRSPNPVLGLGTEAPALLTVSRVQMTVSQALEMGDKRAARKAVAEAAVQEAEARRDEAQRQLLEQAREAYVDLLWAEQRVQLEKKSVGLAERSLTTARERFKLGDVPRIEVMQLEADQSRRLAQQRQAEAELESRRAQLAGRLKLSPADLQVAGSLGLAEALPPLSELLTAAESRRPDLRLLKLTQHKRLAERRLEEARGVSDLTLNFGVAYDRTYIAPTGPTGPLTGIGNPVLSVMGGLSLPLPVNDDNSGNVEAAQRRAEAAESEEAALRLQVRTQVEAAWWQVIANQRARQTLAAETLPLAAQTVAVLEEAYRLRARSLSELLTSRQAYLEASRSHLEAARQEELAVVRLEAASSTDLRSRP